MRVQLKRPWPGRLGAPAQVGLRRAVIQITPHVSRFFMVARLEVGDAAALRAELLAEV